MKRKRGFSLVEVVVSIALITVMSTMTFSILQGVRNITSRSEIRLLASNEIENVSKCYYLSNDDSSFEMYLRALQHDSNFNAHALARENEFSLFVTPDFVLTNEENATYKLDFAVGDKLEIYASVKNISTNKVVYECGVSPTPSE